MYSEEEHRNDPESEGCCCALIQGLRENRRVLVISLLLVATMTAVAKGLYDGISMKEYTSTTIALGIFFPSIIMVIICLYIVIDYTQHTSPRTSPELYNATNRNLSLSSEDIAHRPERCPGNRINVQVEQRFNVSGSPTVNPSRIRTVEIRRKEFRIAKDPSVSCKSPKMSRSCSDLDISRHGHPNCKKGLGERSCKKHENDEMAVEGRRYIKRESGEYSPRCTKYRKVSEPNMRIKRCLSDSFFKNAEEKIPKCNFKLPDNVKRHGGKVPSLKVQKQHSDYKESNDKKFKESIKNILLENNCYPPKNHSGNFKSSMMGNEMYTQIQRNIHRSKSCTYADGHSFQNVKNENVRSPLIKHGMSHSPKTYEGKRAHCEHRQLPHPSARLQKDNLSNESEMPYFLTEETRHQYKQSCSTLLENGQGEMCISSLQSTESRDRVKRKTIYFPSRGFSFPKYPGHAAHQEHSHLSRNDEMVNRLSSNMNENTDCYSMGEPKEKGYRPIGNTPRLSQRTKEDAHYYSMSDTREKKSPTICYVEKRLSSINKGKSDCHSGKELKNSPFCSSSTRLSPKSNEKGNSRSVEGPRVKKSPLPRYF